MGNLSAAKVKALSRPGRYSDGDTLTLLISKKGNKNWIQRVTIHGVRRDIGLGGYPKVSLSKARILRRKNLDAIIDGRDPLAEKRTPKKPIFSEVADETFEMHSKARKWSEDYAKSWKNRLETYAMPIVGNVPIDKITVGHMKRILNPIWTSRADTARKLRQSLNLILLTAVGNEYIEPDMNVAGKALDAIFPPQPAVNENRKDLPISDIHKTLEVIESSNRPQVEKLAFRFLILTATRTRETLEARWDEIDMENRVWTIPKSRMKMRRSENSMPHSVPLSDQALDILETLKEMNGDCEYVFPSPFRRKGSLIKDCLRNFLRHTGLHGKFHVHGLRATFRTWCAKNNKEREHARAALSHRQEGMDPTYQRSDVLELRHILMQEWANFLCREGS